MSPSSVRLKPYEREGFKRVREERDYIDYRVGETDLGRWIFRWTGLGRWMGVRNDGVHGHICCPVSLTRVG